jgi:hypothetical protein
LTYELVSNDLRIAVALMFSTGLGDGPTGSPSLARPVAGRTPAPTGIVERRRRGNYSSGEYRRNRAKILEGKPMCHWCGQRPATTADHVRREGGHELETSCRVAGLATFAAAHLSAARSPS